MRRIVAITNPVIRNLEITECYSRLAAAFAARSGEGANWCTYATWASRQAGRIDSRRGPARAPRAQARARAAGCCIRSATLWRRLLRRGLFQQETRIGRLTAELHTPFDAFERASDAVARGNLKVFEEIGLRVRALPARSARRTSPDCRSGGSSTDCGRATRPTASATCARRSRGTSAGGSRRDPKARTELAVLANLEIGFHEQTRLQPQIREALDAGYATKEDLGRRALDALFPSAARWWPVVRRPAAAVFGTSRRALQRAVRRTPSPAT